MTSEREQYLVEMYSKLFPPMPNIRRFGFEHGDGWFGLIEGLCKEIDSLGDIGFEFDQIKEKFGSLRIYYHGVNDMLRSRLVDYLIDKYENMSKSTCEECGVVAQLENVNGWLTTLCPCHLESFKRESLK